MNRITLLAILFSAALTTCTSPAGGPVEGPTWKLVYMNGEIPEELNITAIFLDGKVTGKGICNRYFADYAIDGGNINIGTVGATKMMCPEHAIVESQYFGALPKAQRFSVKGETLSIQCAEASLRYVKGEASEVSSRGEE